MTSQTSTRTTTRIRLATEAESLQVGAATTASIGRSGQLPLTDRHRKLPAVAALIECGDYQWEVSIPVDVKLWVDLAVGGQRVWSGTAGHRTVCAASEAELLVRTTLGTYRVRVEWNGDQTAAGPRASGTTQLAYRVLQPTEANDRAWIAACADRLTAWNKPALSSARIAEALSGNAPGSTTAGAIDVRLKRTKDKVVDAIELAGATTDGSRNSIVDWLVASAAVDHDLLATALEMERQQVGGTR